MRVVNEISFGDVQNVNYKQNGLLALLFNYGDIIIETAGEQLSANKTSGFVFENVHKPELLADEVAKLYFESKKKYRGL